MAKCCACGKTVETPATGELVLCDECRQPGAKRVQLTCAQCGAKFNAAKTFHGRGKRLCFDCQRAKG